MPATRILVIRHAEKPSDDGRILGVKHDGTNDKEALTVQGWQRAGALAVLFAPARGPLQSPALAVPGTLFASAPVKKDENGANGNGSKSLRPKETITPLADKLGLTINLDFVKGQEAQVAAAAVATDGVV